MSDNVYSIRMLIRPSAEEQHRNPRSSPAKLRWAVRATESPAAPPTY